MFIKFLKNSKIANKGKILKWNTSTKRLVSANKMEIEKDYILGNHTVDFSQKERYLKLQAEKAKATLTKTTKDKTPKGGE